MLKISPSMTEKYERAPIVACDNYRPHSLKVTASERRFFFIPANIATSSLENDLI